MSSTTLSSKELIQSINDWLARPSGMSLDDFLKQRLEAHELKDVLDTVQEIPKVYSEVKTWRAEGKNVNKWLGEQLEPLLQPRERSLKINGVTVDYEEPSRLAAQLIKESSASTFGDDEKGVGNITREISELSESAPEPVREMLENYFASDIDSPIDREVVGVLSGSLIKQLRNQPEITRSQIASISNTVDQGLFAHKLTVKLAKGLLTPEDVVREVDDRAASHLGRMARRVVEDGLEHGGNALGGLIGGWFGNAQLGSAIGKKVGQLAGKFVGPLVEEYAPRVVKFVKKVLTPIASPIKLAKSLFSWF